MAEAEAVPERRPRRWHLPEVPCDEYAGVPVHDKDCWEGMLLATGVTVQVCMS